MNFIQNVINGIKVLLGKDGGGNQPDRVGDHAVVFDPDAGEFYCLRCYRTGDGKRAFVEQECDAPEQSHDIVPYYPDRESQGPLGGMLDQGGMYQQPRTVPEQDGYQCLKCHKWAETKEELKDRECDAY